MTADNENDDPYGAYLRKERTHGRYGYMQWQRAKEANRRADALARECMAWRANMRDAWDALRMIREAVETLGPVGCMVSEEHVNGFISPTPIGEAEAIVAAIMKMEYRP